MGLFAGTEFDRPPRCERCDQLETECECPPEPPFRIPPKDQTAHIAIEKRKRGKLMTVVKGLPLTGNDLPTLLTQLKNSCGAGGTLNDATLEIQGDHRETIRDLLNTIGYRVKVT